jgi:hypothetical protein
MVAGHGREAKGALLEPAPERGLQSATTRNFASHEPLVRRADIPVCQFGRLSSRPSLRRARKPGEPAGRKACPTRWFMAHGQFRKEQAASQAPSPAPPGFRPGTDAGLETGGTREAFPLVAADVRRRISSRSPPHIRLHTSAPTKPAAQIPPGWSKLSTSIRSNNAAYPRCHLSAAGNTRANELDRVSRFSGLGRRGLRGETTLRTIEPAELDSPRGTAGRGLGMTYAKS